MTFLVDLSTTVIRSSISLSSAFGVAKPAAVPFEGSFDTGLFTSDDLRPSRLSLSSVINRSDSFV